MPINLASIKLLRIHPTSPCEISADKSLVIFKMPIAERVPKGTSIEQRQLAPRIQWKYDEIADVGTDPNSIFASAKLPAADLKNLHNVFTDEILLSSHGDDSANRVKRWHDIGRPILAFYGVIPEIERIDLFVTAAQRVKAFLEETKTCNAELLNLIKNKSSQKKIDEANARLDDTVNNFIGFLPAPHTIGLFRDSVGKRIWQDVPYGGAWSLIKYLAQSEAFDLLDPSLKKEERPPAHMCKTSSCPNFVEKPLRGSASPFCRACRIKIRASQERERYLTKRAKSNRRQSNRDSYSSKVTIGNKSAAKRV